MRIINFNTNNGIYLTCLENIITDFHSHPAIEIIYAEKGEFALTINKIEYSKLRFAIIETNKNHKLSASDCELRILLVEHKNRFVAHLLAKQGINLNNGFYSQAHHLNENIIETIFIEIMENRTSAEYDSRVMSAIQFIENNDIGYFSLVKELSLMVHLSESRLSHLFKQSTGISLKKYLVWSKLKKTVHAHLKEKESLFSSMIDSGFYDQAHFIKSYKSMIGISPSKVYNSRILQE